MQETRCPNCNTPYSPGDAFCGECGQALPSASAIANAPDAGQQTIPIQPPVEPTRQEPIQTTAVVTPRVPEKTTTAPTATRPVINPLLIGGGVGGLLLLLLAVFVLPSVFSTPNTTPTPIRTVTANRTGTAGPTSTREMAAVPNNTRTPIAPTNTASPPRATSTRVPPTFTAVPPTPTELVVPPTEAASPTSGPVSTSASFRLEDSPGILDPQLASNVVDVGVIRMIFEPLLELNDAGMPIPGAAESWQSSEDGLIWTLQLREGLVFSDNSPLTADDFVYSWKRVFDPDQLSVYAPLGYMIAGAQDYAQETDDDPDVLAELRDAVGIRALDDLTIEFTLTQQASYFPYLLTLHIGSPVKQEVVEGNEDWTQPATYIGNGPYVLREFDPNNLLAFEANPYYHRGAPRLTSLTARIIPDTSAALASYRSGELDWMLIDPSNLDSINVDENLTADLARSDGSCSYFLVFNTSRAPFNNADVRRAFVQAVDRENWAAQRLNGVKAAHSLIPPGLPGHQPELANTLPFSVDAARQLLSRTSAADLTSLDIEYVPTNSPNAWSLAGVLKQSLDWLNSQLTANLDISLNLRPVSQAQYDSLFFSANTQPLISLGGWCQDYPDPQNWLSTLFRSGTGQVVSFWSNTAFDTAVDQADREPDPAARLQQYNRAQTLLVYDAPALFLEWSENLWLIKPERQDLREHLDSQDNRIPSYSYLINIEE